MTETQIYLDQITFKYKKLQLWIGREGGADNILYFGQKISSELQI